MPEKALKPWIYLPIQVKNSSCLSTHCALGKPTFTPPFLGLIKAEKAGKHTYLPLWFYSFRALARAWSVEFEETIIQLDRSKSLSHVGPSFHYRHRAQGWYTPDPASCPSSCFSRLPSVWVQPAANFVLNGSGLGWSCVRPPSQDFEVNPGYTFYLREGPWGLKVLKHVMFPDFFFCFHGYLCQVGTERVMHDWLCAAFRHTPCLGKKSVYIRQIKFPSLQSTRLTEGINGENAWKVHFCIQKAATHSHFVRSTLF